MCLNSIREPKELYLTLYVFTPYVCVFGLMMSNLKGIEILINTKKRKKKKRRRSWKTRHVEGLIELND